VGGGRAYDAYVWLLHPREGSKEFAVGRVEKAIREGGSLTLKKLTLKEYGIFLGYVVDLPDPPLD
jgi:hypothetical protein